jgi:hypothetical protein
MKPGLGQMRPAQVPADSMSPIAAVLLPVVLAHLQAPPARLLNIYCVLELGPTMTQQARPTADPDAAPL